MTTRESGRRAEAVAAAFARLMGLEIVARNLRVGQKEIDLLLRDGECLVFMEVRFRRSDRWGSAAESVRARKARRLRAALREEIARRRWAGTYRLDLLALDLSPDRSRLVLEHYRGL